MLKNIISVCKSWRRLFPLYWDLLLKIIDIRHCLFAVFSLCYLRFAMIINNALVAANNNISLSFMSEPHKRKHWTTMWAVLPDASNRNTPQIYWKYSHFPHSSFKILTASKGHYLGNHILNILLKQNKHFWVICKYVRAIYRRSFTLIIIGITSYADRSNFVVHSWTTDTD